MHYSYMWEIVFFVSGLVVLWLRSVVVNRLKNGYKRIIVVETRPKEYRKKKSNNNLTNLNLHQQFPNKRSQRNLLYHEFLFQFYSYTDG